MIARETEIEGLMNLHGWDRDEAELVVDARLARELAAGVSDGDYTRSGGDGTIATPDVPPAASFRCDGVCECGGLCDNCDALVKASNTFPTRKAA